MADRRRDGDASGEEHASAGAHEIEAALDELEVRFLLDPDTTFDDDPPRPEAEQPK